MSAAAFDALKFGQTLRDEAKFTPEQDEGLSEAFSQASADHPAAKTGIRDMRSGLRAVKLCLEATVQSSLSETRADPLKWTFGSIGFQTVVIPSAVLALSRLGHEV